jgi:TRAP-type C4-dicarboxylate transport system substrate-binding protein
MFRLRAAGRSVLLGAIILLAAMPSGGVAGSQELRISHQFAAEIDSRDRAARLFVAEALKRAPHLKLSLHPDSALKIKPVEQLDAMVSGELAMSVYPLAYAVPKIPEFAITSFPFVPADLDMAARLKDTLFNQRLQALAEQHGVRILTWWWLPGGLASREREIGGPQTVVGMNLRLPDASVERMFRLAGARSAPFVPSPEMREALRDGRLDGVFTSLESLVGFRVYEQAKWATIGGLGNFMSMQPLLISKSIWDGLTVDEKQALEEAAEASNAYFESTQREAEHKVIEAFTKAGARIHRLDIEEYESWTKLAKDTVWPEYRKLSPTADTLFVTLLTSLIRSGERSGDADRTLPRGRR